MAITLRPHQIERTEYQTLQRMLALLGTDSPTLEQIWECMDFMWDSMGCNSRCLDDVKLSKFYRHPVWLLNGLFIEQHELSIQHRRVFTNWIAAQNPHRVADYGGGFGTLARFIGERCPETEVNIIEPHPHPLAKRYCEEHLNVMYRPWFTGYYDIIAATDVFEHVPDPLNEVERTANFLKLGGYYLIANCFYPVIKCHLPQTFHFRYSWNRALMAMNLEPIEKVAYGTVFKKTGHVSAIRARRLEAISRVLFPLLHHFYPKAKNLSRKIRTLHANMAR